MVSPSDTHGRRVVDDGWTLRSHRVLTNLGDFDDAVISKAVGEADRGPLSD
jgi:hypothetical protein